MKSAFVTGAAGFLGSHLVEALSKEGWEVTGLILPHERMQYESEKVTYVKGNILDLTAKELDIPRNSVVVHCAALTAYTLATEEEFVKTNVEGTLNVYRFAAETHVRQFIYVSSNRANIRGVDEDATSKSYAYSYYGASKKKAEQALEKEYSRWKVPVTILRAAGLYGPRMSPITGFYNLFLMARKKIVPVIRTKTSYQCTFVRNFVQGIIHVMEMKQTSVRRYSFADKPEGTFEDVMRSIAEKLNPDSKILIIPAWLAFTLGMIGRTLQLLLRQRMPLTVNEVKNLTNPQCDSCTLEETGYVQKYTLQEGIEETIAWIKNETSGSSPRMR